MNRGVEFVINNSEKTLKLVNEVSEYNYLKPKVIREYHYIKSIKHTGNMYEHFLKYQGGNHKNAKEFKFLEEYDIIPNEKMADYLKKHFEDELNFIWTVDNLIVGEIYSNNEIVSTFNCSNMGGMRRSKATNSLVLIAKHVNPLYDDQWTEDGILNYTGMGTKGDQSITFGQNKTLAMSKKTGVKVYLFESYKENEYYYCGEVELCGNIYTAHEIDITGKMREVLKFPLQKVDKNTTTIINIEDIEYSEKEKIKEVNKLSPEDIRSKAMCVKSNSIAKEVRAIYRERNQLVSEYTKSRANGICDMCGDPAPFIDKKGKPYLETHHVITLADGGPDVIYNTVALCPNCHRKIHMLNNKEDREKLEKMILKYLLTENDDEILNKYNELFKS